MKLEIVQYKGSNAIVVGYSERSNETLLLFLNKPKTYFHSGTATKVSYKYNEDIIKEIKLNSEIVNGNYFYFTNYYNKTDNFLYIQDSITFEKIMNL